MSRKNNTNKEMEKEPVSSIAEDKTSPDVRVYKDDIEVASGDIDDTIIIKEPDSDIPDDNGEKPALALDGRTFAAEDLMAQEDINKILNGEKIKENLTAEEVDHMAAITVDVIKKHLSISENEEQAIIPKAENYIDKYIRISKIAKSDIKYPDKPSPYSAYYSLYADFANNKFFGDTITIPVNQSRAIPTNLDFDMSEDFRIDIRPLQEYSGDNLFLKYSPITLDRDSKGEIKLAFHNIGNNSVVIRNGQKIAIFVVTLVLDVPIINDSLITMH